MTINTDPALVDFLSVADRFLDSAPYIPAGFEPVRATWWQAVKDRRLRANQFGERPVVGYRVPNYRNGLLGLGETAVSRFSRGVNRGAIEPLLALQNAGLSREQIVPVNAWHKVGLQELQAARLDDSQVVPARDGHRWYVYSETVGGADGRGEPSLLGAIAISTSGEVGIIKPPEQLSEQDPLVFVAQSLRRQLGSQ
jgi:hypothetical protein